MAKAFSKCSLIDEDDAARAPSASNNGMFSRSFKKKRFEYRKVTRKSKLDQLLLDQLLQEY